ncbi:MAG: hypothetical protein FVQ85_08040 [Planctomycetes bacterium]|nr:hypothetical protein [Planctomycetota bacterium]
MIEKALRIRFEPIVKRRRLLYLAWRLSGWWCISALAALVLWGVHRFWGWYSPSLITGLCIATAVMSILIMYKARRIRPDYHAIARAIEQQHPEARAMLLTAVEQEPQGPHDQLGYLQELVIGDTLRHAMRHGWLGTVSAEKLALANLVCLASLVFLIVMLSQLLQGTSALFITDRVLARKGYHITVSPGDTAVESGDTVVILARFDGRVPPEATLYIGPLGREIQPITLTKNLEDPVFGGIIRDVASDMRYYIEYADKRTRDYRISTYQYPAMERADANIVYPSYTNLPQKLIKDTRQISVTEGSRVTLTFTLNKAVARAQLIAKGQAPLELTGDNEYVNIYKTSITATQNQRYELHLTDAQGRANKMPPRFVIDVHKNLPPSLKPLFPNRDIQASALEELSLEAEVSDDFGVTGYGLSYTLAGVTSGDLELGQSTEPKNKQQIKHVLALEDLNAQPDQLLTYYFWANDVGPDGKMRKTLSDMYFAEVRHFDEIFRESQSSQGQQNQRQQQGQQQQGQQADQLAQLQKQIISATWNIKRQADQAGKVKEPNDLEVVRQSQADALQQAQSALAEAQDPTSAQALQAAAEHMETSLEHLSEATQTVSPTELNPALAAEQSAYQELLKLKRREHQIGRSRNSSQSSRSASARSRQQLQQLELKQQQDRYETERLAQSQEQRVQHEDLQMLNRLRELARRQNEMSEKLKELEAALRKAQGEQEQQEIARQLKRLREEQLESLRDVDELQQRMERPENRQRMADAREQLQQARSRIRRSAEELEQDMVSRAITSATRAGRELEQMRDEFRRRTSSEFTERMRNMRDQAQQLDRDQKQIADDLKQQAESSRRLLTDSGVNDELAERIDQQKDKAEELINQMKNVSDEAETAEPLLSKKLYDTLRKTSTDNVDKALKIVGELLRRDFLPQAREVEQHAAKGIEELKEGVEEAAASVIGNEAESLRLAQRQLDELIRQVNDEMARAAGAGRRPGADANEPAVAASGQQQSDDPNRPGASAANQQRSADAQSGRQGQRQNQRSQAREGQPSANASEPGNRTANSERRPGQRPGSQSNQSQTPNARNAERNNPTNRGGGQRLLDQWGGVETTGPLTGNNFRQWSDRMRDVEEMLTRPVQRSQVARARDIARTMRAEFKRHGKEPKWDLVEQQITKPLTELRKRLSDELARLQSDEALVPIDRDPVPDRFAELVRRYYENLGGGD